MLKVMKSNLKTAHSIDNSSLTKPNNNASLKLVKLNSLQLERVQAKANEEWDNESNEEVKYRCILGIHIHVWARTLLFFVFGLSLASIFMLPMDEYRDFKMVASILDNCVIFLALIGNFANNRLLYWPFFLVHAIFIGTLAILTTALLIITIHHVHSQVHESRMEDKEEKLLLILGYNLLQFVLHSYSFIKIGDSYRYLGDVEREKDADLMPNVMSKIENKQLLQKF